MPQGKGTYGTQIGRPSKSKKKSGPSKSRPTTTKDSGRKLGDPSPRKPNASKNKSKRSKGIY